MSVKAFYDGTVMDLQDPATYEVRVESLAEMLAKVKRFNGFGLSVASHSQLVASHVYHVTGDPTAALMALVHDAHEAYIGDVSTPVKDALGDSWLVFEANIQGVIINSLEIGDLKVECGAVKAAIAIIKADAMALKTELLDMVNRGVWSLGDGSAWAFLDDVDVIPNAMLHHAWEDDREDRSAQSFLSAYNRYMKEIQVSTNHN